jgi:hypothetical protein
VEIDAAAFSGPNDIFFLFDFPGFRSSSAGREASFERPIGTKLALLPGRLKKKPEERENAKKQ